MDRSCGVLLPVFALPSPYGIGTLGQAARDFADFLAAAGQSWWQVLPLGPTGFGDSPSQSFSSWAGTPSFRDLEELCRQGLLEKREIESIDWGADPRQVDYGRLWRHRPAVLAQAARRCGQRERAAVEMFRQENHWWLEDYALFTALKSRFAMAPWSAWPDEGARLHRPEALETWGKALEEEVDQAVCLQYLFFRQWQALRQYARSRGVGIIGDVPIYAAMDSADVWAQRENFQLDEQGFPTEVAGVPPDDFSETGQLWGNPLYDWEAMKIDGYGWWIRRMDGARRLYDWIRLDHFRGLESYWAVPYGHTDAREGRWRKGPGLELLRVLEQWFGGLPVIAEDLGLLTPQVHQLREEAGMPGMKVLEFAFSPGEESAYLPHTYPEHCVCYTGTHDNLPLAAWLEEAERGCVDKAVRYLGLNEQEGFCRGVLRGGLSSVARLFIAQMQDYLELGAWARTNTPGTSEGNWRWRLAPGQLTPSLAEEMRQLACLYGRCPCQDNKGEERRNR